MGLLRVHFILLNNQNLACILADYDEDNMKKKEEKLSNAGESLEWRTSRSYCLHVPDFKLSGREFLAFMRIDNIALLIMILVSSIQNLYVAAT